MSVGMPHVKWYGRDWLGDPLLRLIGPAEKGVWIDLLCAMMMGDPYGHLAVCGQPMADADAARMCGTDETTYKGCLARLEAVGIPSRTAEGVLYCRRLVRDHAVFMRSREAGVRGGGNPALRKSPPGPPPEDSDQKKPEARSQRARARTAHMA